MSLYDELFGTANKNLPILFAGLKVLCDRIERLEEHTGGPLVVTSQDLPETHPVVIGNKRRPGRPKKDAA